MELNTITKNARLCLTGKTALRVRSVCRICFVAKDSQYVYTASPFASRICGILTSSRIQGLDQFMPRAGQPPAGQARHAPAAAQAGAAGAAGAATLKADNSLRSRRPPHCGQVSGASSFRRARYSKRAPHLAQ